MANDIIIDSINLGGLSDGKYQGAKNSIAAMRNLDVHTENGIIRLSRGFTNKATVVSHSKDVDAIVPDSSGYTWFFDTDGNVVMRNSSGTYSDATAVNPTGGNGVSDAKQYEDYVYYAMERRIGRFQVQSDGAGYATKADDWGTPTGTGVSDRCMAEVNEILYISAGRYIDQIESGVLTTNVLSFPTGWNITSMGVFGTDLLIGMNKTGNVDQARIVRWNTWSADNSFTSDDLIPESKISAFLPLDNYVIVAAGKRGNLYFYNGSVLAPFKKVPNDGTFNAQGEVKLNAATNFMGQMHFGISKVSGNNIPQGIYSYGSYAAGYPLVLTMPHRISTEDLTGYTGDTNVRITAMAIRDEKLLVAWMDDSSGSNVRGIDESTTTVHSSGYFDTRVINVARTESKTFSVEVAYRTIPENTDIQIWLSKDGGAFAQVDATTDALRKLKCADQDSGECTTIQVRVLLTGSSSSTPEIEQLKISFN